MIHELVTLHTHLPLPLRRLLLQLPAAVLQLLHVQLQVSVPPEQLVPPLRQGGHLSAATRYLRFLYLDLRLYLLNFVLWTFSITYDTRTTFS